MKKAIEFIKQWQAYAKFWVAVIGGVLFIVSDNINLPDEVTKWVQVGIAIVTAFSVYRFPNKIPDVEE